MTVEPENPDEGKPSTPTPIEIAADEALSQAAAAAPSPKKRGRGRPTGSKTRHRSARPSPAPVADIPVELPPPSPAEIAGVGKMLGTLWRIAGERFRRRPLSDLEERELAEASIPVLRKYGAALDPWALEINLVIVLYGLWISTELPKEVAGEAAVVVE